jgi:HEAT repeat protein
MSVCEAIRRIGGPAATTALAAVVAPETDVWVLQPAILALMAIGGSEVVEPLRRALRICESTRAEVATALGRIRDQRAVDDLLDVLQRHFYACGYRRRLARLSERDLSEAEGLVVAAMEALARIGSPRAIQPLLPYLVVPHPRVRRAAAKVLARLGQPQWQERVTGQDEDFHRLGLSGDRSLVAWFIRLLGSDSRHRRLAAAGALAALGEPEWSGLIRGDEDDRTRLLQSPDPRVAEALLLMLGTEEDRAARRQTAEALVRLATATPALLHDSWRRIHRAVTTPHRDEHVDHSDEARAYMHDDRNDYHVDQGLGLEFPAKPPS